MNLIPQYQTKEYLNALEWAKKHSKEMKLQECPYDFTDYANWNNWHKAKYAQSLMQLSAKEQEQRYKADRRIADKMMS